MSDFIRFIIDPEHNLQYKFHTMNEIAKTNVVIINAEPPLVCLKYIGASIKSLLHIRLTISLVIALSDNLVFDNYFTHFLDMSDWTLVCLALRYLCLNSFFHIGIEKI